MKTKQLTPVRKLLALILSSALALSAASAVVFSASPDDEDNGTIIPAEHSFSVIGTFNNWTSDIPMSDEDGDGVYEAVIEDVFPGEQKLKIRMDNEWDYNWGEADYTGCTINGDNLAFRLPYRMDVDVKFYTDLQDSSYWRITTDPVSGSEEKYDQNIGKYRTMSVFGTINGNYDVDTDMDYNSQYNVYTTEFTDIEAGDYEFIIRADHASNYYWGVWDEKTYTSKYGAPVEFSFEADVTKLMLTLDASDESEDNWTIDYDYWTANNLYYSGTAIMSYDEPEYPDFDPKDHTFGVVGAMTDWGASEDIEMTDEDGDGIYSVSIDPVNEKTGFKIRADGEWDHNWGIYNEDEDRTLYGDNACVRPSDENEVEIRFDTNGAYENWTIIVAYIDDQGNARTDRFDENHEEPEDKPDEPISNNIYDYYYFDDDNVLHILPGFERFPEAKGYFAYNDDVFNVVVEFGVSAIPDSLFDGCQELTSVELPDWLTRIGDNAFRDCDKLEGELVLPEDVQYIGESAFAGCRSLSVAVVEVGVQTVSKGAFANCSGLTELAMSSNLRRIEAGAFRRCQGLTEVTIRPNVTEIAGNAFAGCSPDMIIRGVPGTEAEYFAENAGFTFVALDQFDYDHEDDGTIAITRYNGIDERVEIPETIEGKPVTRIGACAFIMNEHIRSVYIPDTVKTIGMITFQDCTNLRNVRLSENLELINGGAFMNCGSLESITLPESLTVIGPHAFAGCSELESINEVYSLQDMGAQAFDDTRWYADHEDGEVYFGNIFIGFKGEAPMGSTLNIKEGTTGVAAGAIAPSVSKNAFVDVHFPSSLTTVGPNAFWEMFNYTEITIPETVTRIEDGAFGCYWDQENGRIGHVDGVVFYVKEGSAAYRYAKNNGFDYVITEAMAHSGETGDCTWEYDPDRWTVTISGNGAMADYTLNDPAPWRDLEVYNFIVTDGVTTVGSDACIGLGGEEQGLYVSLPDSVISIGDNAFNAINGPLELNGNRKTELPASLETIGNYAIFNPAVNNISVPATVTSIGVCGIGYWYNEQTQRDEKVENYTIHCVKGSAADNYAQENDIFFVYVMDNGLEYIVNDNDTVTITGFVSGAESLVIPDEIDGMPVEEIGDEAFRGNFDTLEEVTLPSGLKRIGKSAFNSLFRMRSIQFPDGLEYIGEAAFAYTNLSYVDLPDSVSDIGAYAFFTTDFSGVDIPASVSFIGERAFGYTISGDTSVKIDDFCICGTPDTAAEAYALDSGFEFIDINAGKLRNTSTLNSEKLSLGSKVMIKAAAENAEGELSYSYYYKKSTARNWTTLIENTAASTANFTPKSCADYDVKVVINTGFEQAERILQVSIVDGSNAAFTNNSSLSTTEAKPNTRINITGSVEGSEGNVKYAFYYKRSTASNWTVIGTEYDGSNAASFKPRSEGKFDVKIDAIDGSGELVSKVIPLVISENAGNLPVNKSTVNSESINLGEKVIITGAAEGGAGGYSYTYQQKKSTSTSWSTLAADTTETTASFKPRSTGTYDVLVTVKDSNGAEAELAFVITVN